MEFSRRGFVLSAFSLAFISSYPRFSHACGVSFDFNKMSVANMALLTIGAIVGVIIIAKMPVIVPILLAVGAGAWVIDKMIDSEKVGSILCNQ